MLLDAVAYRVVTELLCPGVVAVTPVLNLAWPMEGIRDLRLALRSLRKAPSFAAHQLRLD